MRSTTEMARLYEQSGFTLIRRNKHPIWQCPCGHRQLVDTSTQSGGRGSTNARLRIARTLKQCALRKEEAA